VNSIRPRSKLHKPIDSHSSHFPFAADPQHLYLQIAGISIGVHCPGDMVIAPEPEMALFQVGERKCEIEVETKWTDRVAIPDCASQFESGGLWSAYTTSDQHMFFFTSQHWGAQPYKAAQFDREFRSGRVQLSRQVFDPGAAHYPLEYPLDELMMIHRLALGEGLEVHGCGIIDNDGMGRLFVGHSGAGKSTTARMWLNQPGARVLSDDRIILRFSEGGLRMHGTPWHGDAGLAAQQSAPVHQILFLEHAQRNRIVALERSAAAAELYVRCFVPHYLQHGIALVLELVDRVVAAIPAYRLEFVPDASAIEAVRDAA
jgi:hypothetical protein